MLKINNDARTQKFKQVLNKFKVSYKTTPAPPELLQYPKFIWKQIPYLMS